MHFTTTNGSVSRTCCPAERAMSAPLPKTIACLWRRCCGDIAVARPGAIFPNASATGITRTDVSVAGPRPASGSEFKHLAADPDNEYAMIDSTIVRAHQHSAGAPKKMLWGERRGQWHHRRSSESMERPMPQQNDLSRSLVILEQDATLIAVIEMGQSNWLVAGIVPGVERSPLKKLAVDESGLLKLLNRWREEAEKAGHRIERIAIAFEAGRDGFWLARWLRARGIEAHVIHASSVAVSREHRRAKTDRLDTELLKRAFLGWLRGERDHCKIVAIPTLAQEDAKRPNRERESLVGEQSRIVNRMKAALARLGIRGFNPKLKKAVGRLDGLRTPEGEPIPPNTLAELKHDMERRRLVRVQLYERSYIEFLRQLRPAPLQARDGADDGSRWRGPDRPPWLSCREKEWVRRLGASPPMRMSASWFGSLDPPNTRSWRD